MGARWRGREGGANARWPLRWRAICLCASLLDLQRLWLQTSGMMSLHDTRSLSVSLLSTCENVVVDSVCDVCDLCVGQVCGVCVCVCVSSVEIFVRVLSGAA